jgi:hypothetical protein
MRITIQVTCEDAEDAKKVIGKLTAPDNTWVDQLDATPVKSPPVPSPARIDKIIKASERPNASPGEPSIGKIGSDTKENILRALKEGQPIGAKFVEHLKLLWKRGEVKYDGDEYYL